MKKFATVPLTIALVLLAAGPAVTQVRQYPLESIDGLILHNVAATPVSLDGRKGLRLTMSDDARREQRQVEQLARIKDLEFSNGVIEVELAGGPAPDAPAGRIDGFSAQPTARPLAMTSASVTGPPRSSTGW